MALTKVSYSMITGAPLNVLDYGADPTGVADSSTAIKTAIDAAGAAGGKGVYLPKGTYLLGSTLQYTAIANNRNITLFGDGSSVSIIKKGFNGDLITITGVGQNEFLNLGFNGDVATRTGKGIVFSGSSFRPVISNCTFLGFAGPAIEFGADSGVSAHVMNVNVLPGDSRTDYSGIATNGPDTTAIFRSFSDVNISLGYMDLSGAIDTMVATSAFKRIVTTSGTSILTVMGCIWANIGGAMTLNGVNMCVHGCRFAGDVTLSSSFTGSFIGNQQTAGTFTDNSIGANATILHHELTKSYLTFTRQTLVTPSANERIISSRTANVPAASTLTLTVGSSAPVTIVNSALSATMTITLSTTDALAGDRFRIVRSAAATGAFNIDVDGLKTLTAASQWCDVEYSGSAWVLTAAGSL